MAAIDDAAVSTTPVPVETPVSMRELTALLIKHYGLHEGRYDLLVEYQMGVGPVGPDPTNFVPGVMFGVGRVGLLAARGDGPTAVDAAVVNPMPVMQKKPAKKSAKVPRAKSAT